MTPDPLTAIVDQLAAHGEQLTRLDAREARHHATLTALLAGLTDRPTPDLAGQEPGGYQPGPPPAWWTLTADARHEPLARLRGWVDQVYLPEDRRYYEPVERGYEAEIRKRLEELRAKRTLTS